MPGLDRTGPAGMGPMTGGARGLCNPYDVPYVSGRPLGAVRPGFRFYPRSRALGSPRLGLGRGFRGQGGRGRGRW